jgi:hypothetical protein
MQPHRWSPPDLPARAVRSTAAWPVTLFLSAATATATMAVTNEMVTTEAATGTIARSFGCN